MHRLYADPDNRRHGLCQVGFLGRSGSGWDLPEPGTILSQFIVDVIQRVPRRPLRRHLPAARALGLQPTLGASALPVRRSRRPGRQLGIDGSRMLLSPAASVSQLRLGMADEVTTLRAGGPGWRARRHPADVRQVADRRLHGGKPSQRWGHFTPERRRLRRTAGEGRRRGSRPARGRCPHLRFVLPPHRVAISTGHCKYPSHAHVSPRNPRRLPCSSLR